MRTIFNQFLMVFVIIVLLVAFIGGFVLGRISMNAGNEEISITSEIILDKITDQYFVVSKTLFLNQEIEISISEGSEWEDIFWGKKITGEGIVRADIGVDLINLNPTDIEIDNVTKTVRINLPEPTILDSSIYGDIQFETEKGIITNIEDLIEGDESKDYNEAVNTMLDQAEKEIESNEEYKSQAQKDSKKVLELIVSSMGYTLK